MSSKEYRREYYLKHREEDLAKKRKSYKSQRTIYAKWYNSYSSGLLTITKVSPDGKVKRYLVKVDDEDINDLKKHKWRVDYNTQPSCWELDSETDTRSFMFLHRFVMDPKPEQKVRNINHNYLDCRKENLAICGSLSCVFRNSKRAICGITLHTDNRDNLYYIKAVLNNHQVTILKCQTKEQQFKVAHKLRTLPITEAIGTVKTMHLEHLQGYTGKGLTETDYGFRIYFGSKYIGYMNDYVKAIEFRREYILQLHTNFWQKVKTFGYERVKP